VQPLCDSSVSCFVRVAMDSADIATRGVADVVGRLLLVDHADVLWRNGCTGRVAAWYVGCVRIH